MKKKFLIILFVFIFVIVLVLFIKLSSLNKPTPTNLPQGVRLDEISESIETTTPQKDIQIIAENLSVPWEIVFLPDESLLVSERPGNLLRIFEDSKEKIPIQGVEHIGEGGLLGMTLHPNFETNQFLYIYFTTKIDSQITNRIERYKFDLTTNSLSDKTTILENIPGATYHDGGRIAFGPDGYLYITTGDATNEDSAQDKDSLSGKILRINDDGTIPSGNPFGTAVYSYGHRNSQGIAWDTEGRLWSTEHGPSVLDSGKDEVNLIIKGENYGWPIITGDETNSGMQSPVIQSGKDETWAPTDLLIVNDVLLFTGLRGESLYSATIVDDELLNLKVNFREDFGRLRVVNLGTDGWIYLATSNQDGRGNVNEGDDKIIKINPELILN